MLDLASSGRTSPTLATLPPASTHPPDHARPRLPRRLDALVHKALDSAGAGSLQLPEARVEARTQRHDLRSLPSRGRQELLNSGSDGGHSGVLASIDERAGRRVEAAAREASHKRVRPVPFRDGRVLAARRLRGRRWVRPQSLCGSALLPPPPPPTSLAAPSTQRLCRSAEGDCPRAPPSALAPLRPALQPTRSQRAATFSA